MPPNAIRAWRRCFFGTQARTFVVGRVHREMGLDLFREVPVRAPAVEQGR
jgi:hypothetical protein